MTHRSLLFCVFTSVLCLLVASCGRMSDVGIYVIKADQLADDAILLEDAITLAGDGLPDELRPGFTRAVADLRYLAGEIKRLAALNDFETADLTRLSRYYERVRGDVRFIRGLVYDAPDFTVWNTLTPYDQLQLEDWYNRAAALDGYIQALINGPATADYVQTTARMAAYATLAARLALVVLPQLIENGAS
jgi:hypothetical protein